MTSVFVPIKPRFHCLISQLAVKQTHSIKAENLLFRPTFFVNFSCCWLKFKSHLNVRAPLSSISDKVELRHFQRQFYDLISLLETKQTHQTEAENLLFQLVFFANFSCNLKKFKMGREHASSTFPHKRQG